MFDTTTGILPNYCISSCNSQYLLALMLWFLFIPPQKNTAQKFFKKPLINDSSHVFSKNQPTPEKPHSIFPLWVFWRFETGSSSLDSNFKAWLSRTIVSASQRQHCAWVVFPRGKWRCRRCFFPNPSYKLVAGEITIRSKNLLIKIGSFPQFAAQFGMNQKDCF